MQGSGQGNGRWRRRRNAGIWAGAWNLEEEECRDLGRAMVDGGGGMHGSGQGH